MQKNLLNTFNNLVFTARGTTGIWVLLEALKERYPERKLLLPINICEIVYPMVLHAGWEPIFFDVNPITGVGGINEIKAAYSQNDAVLLLVHNFGLPIPMAPVIDWAKQHNVFVIEDICNALGATDQGQFVGSFGDAAVLSFGHAKILEKGNGGAVWVRNESLRLSVDAINDKLLLATDSHLQLSLEFEGAIQTFRKKAIKGPAFLRLYQDFIPHLLVQPPLGLGAFWENSTEQLEQSISKRNAIAKKYRSELSQNNIAHVPHQEGQVYWRYNIHLDAKQREKMRLDLQNLGVYTSCWYPPLSDLFHCNDTRKFPGASRFHQTILNLFVDQHATDEMQQQLIQYFKSIPAKACIPS